MCMYVYIYIYIYTCVYFRTLNTGALECRTCLLGRASGAEKQRRPPPRQGSHPKATSCNQIG